MDASKVGTAVEELDALGLEIHEVGVLRSNYSHPFDQFGTEAFDSKTGSE
ncbi:hypothetical protein [Haloterrigena salina]|nr:hypothetical protein [Haloterrigena salina]